jgi:hypothetical protein
MESNRKSDQGSSWTVAPVEEEEEEHLRNLCSSPSIIRVIKSRRIEWTWHVAFIGEAINAYALLVKKLKGNLKRIRQDMPTLKLRLEHGTPPPPNHHDIKSCVWKLIFVFITIIIS